ncbi:hypothetical protein D3C87_339580 [compost metagenome]
MTFPGSLAPTIPMKSSKIISTNESERLRELVREIGLPLKKLPDIISAGREDCLAWWSNQDVNLKINATHFARLTALIGIDENELYLGSYDKDLARRRLLGDYNSLPMRYQENKNSYLRTSAHIIRYIVLTRGQWFADQVLNSMNVSPLIYQDLNTQINLTYFADLLETLEKRGFTQEELDTLASVIFLSLQETQLGDRFSESEDFFDIYSTLANNFNYFDSNFEYKSHFVGKKYVLTTVLPLNQHEYLKNNPQNIQRLMRYRHILLAWFPYLGGMTPLFPKTELIRCSDVVEMKYEFELKANLTRPIHFQVV